MLLITNIIIIKINQFFIVMDLEGLFKIKNQTRPNPWPILVGSIEQPNSTFQLGQVGPMFT